jgi:hypothetical protein
MVVSRGNFVKIYLQLTEVTHAYVFHVLVSIFQLVLLLLAQVLLLLNFLLRSNIPQTAQKSFSINLPTPAGSKCQLRV